MTRTGIPVAPRPLARVLAQESEAIEREPSTGGPAFRFPVELTINDHPALRLAATVVEPAAPHGLTAGIVRVDGFRPTDDRYRFRASLVLPD